jgi:hypothetical protein
MTTLIYLFIYYELLFIYYELLFIYYELLLLLDVRDVTVLKNLRTIKEGCL